MNIVCLDMEGVLVPEIWIAFSEATGIPELRRTTRDEPDYDKLMKYRIAILKERGLGLSEIQDVISTIDPLPGAKEFLDELRSMTQVVILSDTFEQFAGPLIRKLGMPTLFCNTLDVSPTGEITGYWMRCSQSKLSAVKAFRSIGYDVVSAGDSYNDMAMIRASQAGFLFKSTAQIIADNPEIPAYDEFSDLLGAMKNAFARLDADADKIETAKAEISSATASVAMVTADGKVYSDKGKSVRPLARLYHEHTAEMKDAVVADSIIGRAAASYIVAGEAKECFGFTMSQTGLDYLRDHGIKATYGTLVPVILNWNETDLCPMEKLSLKSSQPEDSVEALDEFIRTTPYPPAR